MNQRIFAVIALCLGLFTQVTFGAEINDLDTQGITAQQLKLGYISQTKLADGTHTRYHQLINGFPVYGFHIIKHDTAQGVSYSGKYLHYTPNDSFVRRAHFDIETAFNRITAFLHDPDFESIQFKQGELMYYLDSKQSVHLAYVLNYFSDSQGTPRRPYAIIDANTGDILKHWQGLTTDYIGKGPGGNKKTGAYFYGSQFRSFDVKRAADETTCLMDSPIVKTINLNNGTSGTKAFSFTCPEHSGETSNGSFSTINDAQYLAQRTYDMYDSWYHLPPLRSKLIMRVHYAKDYENAYWNGRTMTFGDGKDSFYPFMAADIVSHEITHGFTEQHSKLEYWGQSGAINEAFSDMAGKALEQFTQLHYDWTIGSKFTKKEHALRYMDHPSKDGVSIEHVQSFHAKTDVHHGSGVFNRAFYLLASTEGWRVKTAFEVMVRANAIYWQPMSTFNSAAAGVIQSAQDLSYSASDVVHAFKEVGINCSQLPNSTHYDCVTLPA